MDSVRADLAQRLRCDYPTKSQLEMMNKWKPNGQADYGEQELISVPILASNNMLRQDMSVWTEKALRSMTATYGGQPLMLNHDWFEVRTSIGFIYDAEIVKIPAGGGASKQFLMERSINADVDGSIYDKQGFMAVICYAAVPADSPSAGAIRNRQLSDVSTGGVFRNGAEVLCPLCGGDFGDDDPHYPPSWYANNLVREGKLKEEDVAPFVWVDGWHDSVELSFVTAGNVPGATIFTEDLTKLIWL